MCTGGSNPIWTAQLTAHGSLITYVRKIGRAPLFALTTKTNVTSTLVPPCVMPENGGGRVDSSERLVSRDQSAPRCVSIRLIEQRDRVASDIIVK